MDDITVFTGLQQKYLDKNFKDSLELYNPTITDVMKSNGGFTRYFAHFISTPQKIYEISPDHYQKLKKNPFYVVVKLIWYIIGQKETTLKTSNTREVRLVGVSDTNRKNVDDALLTMPYLVYYLTDYTQFWQG